MSSQKAEHCMICGLPLRYGEQGKDVTCTECGREETSAISCPGGHYVCNTCHSKPIIERLPDLARKTQGNAPEDILEEFLALPGLAMHGPEHHAMAGLAMLLACHRTGVSLQEDYIEEMIRRSMLIPGGACGYLGACGGGISLGVAVSLVTKATPVTGLARGLSNRAAAIALNSCGDDDARCCKRALRKTVAAGRAFFLEELNIELPVPSTWQVCRDIDRNDECAGERCPYFGRQQSQH